jgi:hypothetical protein
MQNIGKLKTIVSDMVLQLTGGGLGNQVSDADREFIIERVGNLADPNVPVEQRLAAWDAVKQRMGNILGIKPRADSGVTNQSVTGSGNGFNERPANDAGAFIDSMVQQRAPYATALAEFNRRFPGFKGPNGESGFSPSQYQAAVDFYQRHPGLGSNPARAIERTPLSGVERANNALAQTGPVAGIGHFANAAVGGIPTLLAGDQGQYFNQVSRQQHPVYSALGDIGGAVAGALGVNRGLKAGGEAISDFAPGLSKFLGRAGPRAALADTVYGGTFGATQNPDDPLAGAAIGAGSMLAGNAVGRFVLGPGIAAAGTTRPGRAVAGMFGGPAPAARLPSGDNQIAGATGKSVGEILQKMDEASNLGLPFSLADASPQLRVLAGSAVRKSPNVRQLAEDTLGPRQLGQGDRAIAAINTHLAPTADIGQLTDDALTRARAASQPLYEKAMQRVAPSDAKLTELMNTPAGQSAAREAYTIALNKGEKPGDLSFHTLDDGTIVIDGNPNWRTLQYMKQGTDSIVEKARNQTTGQLNLKDPSVRGLSDFRTQFTNRLHVLNPDLEAADNAFAKFAKQGTAANMGAAATARTVTPDTVAGVIGNTAPEHLPFYRQGFASSLANRVDNAPFSSDPYKLIFGSPAQQAKVLSVFPEGAPTFGRINSLEGDMAKTAHETLGGSPTAARVAADSAFDGPMGLAGDLAFTAATGTPTPSLLARAGRAGMDHIRLGRGTKRAEQIGPILLDTDPAKSAAYLRNLTDLAAARREYLARSRAAGGMFGAPLALPFIPNQ